MTTKATMAKRPAYMLKSGSEPISPLVNFDSSGQHCICVYGFSGKPTYDKFIQSTTELLTPYPLVKRFLADHVAGADASVSGDAGPLLVILEATSATQPVVVAATMATVIRAMEENEKEVPVEFELVFDADKATYQITVG